MSSILRKCARRAETVLEFIPDNEKYLILKDGERYSRVAVRNLCKKKDPDMTLVIRKGLLSDNLQNKIFLSHKLIQNESYEPVDTPVEMVIQLIGDITKAKVNYFYKKSQLNVVVNSMLFYPSNKREYDIVRSKLADTRYWTRNGIKKVFSYIHFSQFWNFVQRETLKDNWTINILRPLHEDDVIKYWLIWIIKSRRVRFSLKNK